MLSWKLKSLQIFSLKEAGVIKRSMSNFNINISLLFSQLIILNYIQDSGRRVGCNSICLQTKDKLSSLAVPQLIHYGCSQMHDKEVFSQQNLQHLDQRYAKPTATQKPYNLSYMPNVELSYTYYRNRILNMSYFQVIQQLQQFCFSLQLRSIQRNQFSHMQLS